MAKYFTSRLNYFTSQRRVKIRPESEISSHTTLMSVISGLFYPNAVGSTRGLVSQCKVGCRGYPHSQLIF